MPINEFMTEITTTLKNLPALVDQVNLFIKNPTGILIITLGLPSYILIKNFNAIFTYFESKKNKKINLITGYLKDLESEKGDVYEELKDKRDLLYFEITTGVRAEQKLRAVLIELHKKTPPSITWTIVRRAIEYIEVDSVGNAKIRQQTKIEKVMYWMNIIFGSFVLLYGLLIILMNFVIKNGIYNIFLTFFISIPFGAFALYIFTQNWPWIAAMRISEHTIPTQKNEFT